MLYGLHIYIYYHLYKNLLVLVLLSHLLLHLGLLACFLKLLALLLALLMVLSMVACGGPNIYIDTASALVKLYWWTEYAEYPLSYSARDAIDEWAEEYWNI